MRPPFIALAAGVLLVVSACGAEPSGGIHADDATPALPDELLQTQEPVTVLDDGDGPELCLGGVAESLPPQCGGPRLIGWDWAEFDGHYEQASDVRWGDFHVVGTFDGGGHDGTVSVDKATPASEWDGDLPPHDRDFATPCPEPEGGWQVIDPGLTTTEAQERVFRTAQRLDGYAGGWVDQSINPVSERLDDPDHEVTEEDELAMNDPTRTIVNIRVVGDVATAEAELRRVWGGALCVSRAELTEAELRSLQEELNQRFDVLGSGTDVTTGTVEVQVIHDDGTVQAALDAEYGAYVVRVRSALVPVP